MYRTITLLIKVARGIGGMALSLILRQFCEDYRHNRSGMPDLILWRSSTDSSELIDHANGLIFAEVKSPNDRLSDGQRHWFSLLKNGGLRVVLVRVLGEITEISENGNELEAPKKDQFKIKSTNVQ
jgi:fanconi-associated nuclease 1